MSSSAASPGGRQAAHAAERSAWEVARRELKSKLDRGEVTLIDVREPHEWEIARIPGARLIPLGELPNRFAELPMDGDIVLHCHKGVRSMRALELLRDHAGFKRRQEPGAAASTPGRPRWIPASRATELNRGGRSPAGAGRPAAGSAWP